MSKISAKTRYETFQEWHQWAKKQYPSFRVKKKKPQIPDWMSGAYNNE